MSNMMDVVDEDDAWFRQIIVREIWQNGQDDEAPEVARGGAPEVARGDSQEGARGGASEVARGGAPEVARGGAPEDTQEDTQGAANVQNARKKRYCPRTTVEQQGYFINFAKTSPALLDNCSKEYKRLWETLTKELNDQPGPNHSAKEWQDKFKNWEYSITHKMRGGEKPLKPIEKEALEIFGKIKITGIHGATSLGFSSSTIGTPISEGSRNPSPLSEPVGSTSAIRPIPGPSSANLESLEDSSNGPPARKRRTVASRIDAVIDMMEDQKEREIERQNADIERLKMEKEKLEIDKRNAETWNTVAQSVFHLTQAFMRNSDTTPRPQ